MSQGFAVRPPAKFAVGGDFTLWCKRFELCYTRAKIPEGDLKKELLSLIEDGSFRIVDKLGLVEEGDYKEILKCLRKRFVPEGNELEWQFCLQNRSQRSGEALEEFAGELRMLADKSFPSWIAAQRLQLVQDQFIRGVSSSSTQLTLMKENPDTIEASFASCS